MSERLKAAIVVRQDLESAGGTQRSTRNILDYFNNITNNKPVDWTLVSPYKYTKAFPHSYIALGGLGLKSDRFYEPVITPNALVRTRRELEKLNPDLILITSPDDYTSLVFFALPPNLKSKAAVIWRYMADTVIPADRPVWMPEIIHKMGISELINCRRKIGNAVPVNVAISQSVADSLVRIGIRPERIQIAPTQTGWEFSPEMRIKYGSDYRKQFLEPDELGILTVGRIAPEKNMDWVVDLYRKLRLLRKHLSADAYYKKVKITVIGGPSSVQKQLFDQLQMQAQQASSITQNYHASGSVSIEWLGEKPWSEIQNWYNAYDIFYMPSSNEPFGRVTVESMTSGMTVFGRASSQTTAAILSESPYDIGILVETPQNAAETILDIMNHPKLLFYLQSNALQWASHHYSLDRVQNAFWTALNPIVAAV